MLILLEFVVNRLAVRDVAQVHEGGQVDVIRKEVNAAVAKDHVETAGVRGAEALVGIGVGVAVAVVVRLGQVICIAERVVVPAGGVTSLSVRSYNRRGDTGACARPPLQRGIGNAVRDVCDAVADVAMGDDPVLVQVAAAVIPGGVPQKRLRGNTSSQ